MQASAQRWTAIILAGQRPGTDPLAQHFGTEWKALVPVAGQAMLTHVVRTLHAVPAITRIVVLGQDPDALRPATDAGGGATIMQSGMGIATSIAACAGGADAPWPVLVTTADHPLLTPAMVTQFISGIRADGGADGGAGIGADSGADSGWADVAVAMVERRVMLAQYPDAQRTWLRFRDGAWSGANLFGLTGPRALAALQLWAGAEQDRKRPVRLLLHFGIGLALRAITRTIGLDAALMRAGRRLGLTARLVAMTDPVAAIDVDKLSDHRQAEAILAERRARGELRS